MAAARIVSGTEDVSAMDQGGAMKLRTAMADRVGVFICSSRKDVTTGLGLNTAARETPHLVGRYLCGSTVRSGAPFGTISTAIAAADSVSLALSATVCSPPGRSKQRCPVCTS